MITPTSKLALFFSVATLSLSAINLHSATPIRFGVCTGVENAGNLKEAGCDYLELSLSGVARMSDSEFASLLAQASQAPVKPEAMNGFLPAALRVVGAGTALAELQTYTAGALHRANLLGVKIVVFGSGGARKIPGGFSRSEAEEQVVSFLRMVSSEAAKYPGMTIVIEPLRPEETNFINTVADGLRIAKRVDRPNIRTMADLYHIGSQKETLQAVLDGGKEWIRHCHIARVEGRIYPSPGDSSAELYKQFFAALKSIGYTGRMSVEAKAANGLKKDAPVTLTLLRQLAAENL